MANTPAVEIPQCLAKFINLPKVIWGQDDAGSLLHNPTWTALGVYPLLDFSSLLPAPLPSLFPSFLCSSQ